MHILMHILIFIAELLGGLAGPAGFLYFSPIRQILKDMENNR